jgi:hypothetical protein
MQGKGKKNTMQGRTYQKYFCKINIFFIIKIKLIYIKKGKQFLKK